MNNNYNNNNNNNNDDDNNIVSNLLRERNKKGMRYIFTISLYLFNLLYSRFSVVTQCNVLRDNTKIGCVADYYLFI